MSKKRGPKTTFWKDGKGKVHVAEVNGKQVGLVQGKDGRFRPSGHSSPKWRNDPAYAIHEFRKWVETQGQTVHPLLSIPEITQEDAAEFARHGLDDKDIAEIAKARERIGRGQHENEREKWKAYYRGLIYSDIHKARLELDIPELNIDGDAIPESLPLDEIGSLYAKRSFNDPNESKRSAEIWGEFCDAVQPAKAVAEISEDQLLAYRNWVYQHRTPAHKARAKVGESVLLPFDRWKKEKRKQDKKRTHEPMLAKKTIKNRIHKVASILRYASDHRKKHRAEIQELLGDFRKIVKAPKNGTGKGKATPIHPDDFAALLEVVDMQWKAQLLLMLNCALHPGEMADVRVEDIDFRRKTLSNKRRKTEIQRVAILWGRTVEAIQEYRKAKPHRRALLFVNGDGAEWTTNQLNKRFAEFRKAAGLPESVKMDDIRDGARNAASEGNANPEHTAMLMGHELPGAADHYVQRTPSKTRDVVDAIEAGYFAKDEGKRESEPEKSRGKKSKGKQA